MSLSGQQRKQLQEALIDAFPTTAPLEQMLSFELEKSLRAIAGEGSLQEIVFRLIQAADSQGWVGDLVHAARQSNPGNSLLNAIAQELLKGETPQASSPDLPQEPSRSATIAKPRSTQQQKILVSGAAVVIIFVLIAGVATLRTLPSKEQPTLSRSPTDSTSPSKPSLSSEKGVDYNQLRDLLAAKKVQPPEIDDLSSDRNVDYTRLRNLLAAGNWKDADYETYLVTLKVVGRQEGDWIREEELLNFPCTDLRTVDSLWAKYSSGRFGFSVQKKIYLNVGGKVDKFTSARVLELFGDLVEWRMNGSWISYDNVTFDTTAPVGHLPVPITHDVLLKHRKIIFSRIETCKF